MSAYAKGGSHSVRGHGTKNGTYVAPTRATNRNSTYRARKGRRTHGLRHSLGMNFRLCDHAERKHLSINFVFKPDSAADRLTTFTMDVPQQGLF